MQSPVFPYLGEDEHFEFPDPEEAGAQGVLARGGNLSPGMLLSAYRQGIFPWFSEDEPILWWAPDPRFVIYTADVHVSRSMKRVLNRDDVLVSADTDFDAVIDQCARIDRPGQYGTWITDEMIAGYGELHRLGYAHSIEVRTHPKDLNGTEDDLVGGLYGVSIGRIFFGESMFSRRPNMSKLAFILLSRFVADQGFQLIDSQVYTRHLARLGGSAIPRARYMEELSQALAHETLRGSWADRFRTWRG